MQKYMFRWVGFLTIILAGCAQPMPGGGTPQATAPRLYEGMGSHRRPITTVSAEAQRYFDQGLVWTFAFNHDEAIRSFGEAARIDPDCALAWWGIALCNGPHINNPIMDERHSRAAWDALQKAQSLADKANPTERSLIQALSKRYASTPPADRKPLNEAYANAMREVWSTHGDDNDIGTLFAEAMMDLRPWNLWTHDGRPQPGTEEIVAALETVLQRDPRHPGANHLYIHAVEASEHPDKAMATADRLRNLVPASGHLVHMPSHIDVRTGRWAEAAQTNERAIAADAAYRKISPRQGFYSVYMAHNHQFLSYASMMEGCSATAIRAAREMIAGVPDEFARTQPAFVDPVMMLPIDAMMRFGKWDEILREPAPRRIFPITTALWHFARGIAFAAKGNTNAALREQAEFKKAAAKVAPDALMAINPAKKVLDIAEHMLAGEIAFRQGKIDDSVSSLQKAVEIEDGLQYMEPPDWIQPVRHTLGAVLVSAGRFADAEKVYRDDLQRWPENGWSLYGLSKCLKERTAGAEAADVQRRFEKAWSRADTKIDASCLCASKAGR